MVMRGLIRVVPSTCAWAGRAGQLACGGTWSANIELKLSSLERRSASFNLTITCAVSDREGASSEGVERGAEAGGSWATVDQ